jgi:hypothetical protein
VGGWLGKKFFHWDSLSADLQLTVRDLKNTDL